MSKMNAVRFINLNYNNNAIKISDEIFQMHGKSTLLSLRNGGGKSVLVQMMTAPVVDKAYRKTKDRPVESYFTSMKPSFILVEWALDNGAGYCLVGMMVRKNQSIEEDSADKLEITNFICEYPRRCDYDIYHIPLVEKNKKEIILKPYRECKQLFENYKKECSMKFNYYDMNNSAQSRQYFDKLSEYQIYYKEWENIIRKVNLKESGLSELFSDCKDEKDLIDKWFIDAVQNKLNGDTSKIKGFQELVEKYVGTYRDNKVQMQNCDTIKQFMEDSGELENISNQYLESEKEVESQEKMIACFLKELHKLEEQLSDDRDVILGQKTDCDEEIAHLEYESLSMEVYEMLDKQKFHISNREMIEIEKESLEEERNSIQKCIYTMQCAKQKESVDEYRLDLMKVQELIAAALDKEKEHEPERKRLGGQLMTFYEDKTQETKETIEEQEKEKTQIQNKIQESKEREDTSKQQYQKVLDEITESKTKIKIFDRQEDDYNDRFKENFRRNIVGEYEAGALEIAKEKYQNQYTEAKRNLTQHKKRKEELVEILHGCQRKLEDDRAEKLQLGFEEENQKKQHEEYDRQLKERRIIMRYIDEPEKEIWNLDRLIAAATRKVSEAERVKRILEQEENELQKEWKKLTSGKLLELPQEFEDSLKELDIHYVYGMDWLDKNSYSEKENLELVRKQPFLPYSLIISRQEIERFVKYNKKELYTSFPIPIIAREELEHAINKDSDSLVSFDGICFYMLFNEKLLNEKELQILINQKTAEINSKKEQIKTKTQEHEEYLKKREELKNQTVTLENYNDLQNREQELENKKQENEKAIEEHLKEQKTFNEEQQNMEVLIEQEKQQCSFMEEREKEFDRFCEDYVLYIEEIKKQELKEQEKRRLEDQIKLLQSSMEKHTEALRTLENRLFDSNKMLSLYREKALNYQEYDTVDEKISSARVEELEAKYEAITTKVSVQLKDLQSQSKKAAGYLSKAEHELSRLEKKYGLSIDDYKDTVYQEEEENHHEIVLEDKVRKIAVKDRQLNDENTEIKVIENLIVEKKKNISEHCGQDELLPRDEIRQIDFKAQINQLQYKIKEYEKQLSALDKHLKSVGENLTTLAEYEELLAKLTDLMKEKSPDKADDINAVNEISNRIASEISEFDGKQLREYQGKMIRDYKLSQKAKSGNKENVENYLRKLAMKPMYQEEAFIRTIDVMLTLTDNARLILEQLHTSLQSYESLLKKLEVDLAIVGKERQTVLGLIEDYVKEVHRNLGQIDNNSTITIRNRPIKMLKLIIPEWEENESLYQVRLNDFMDEITQKSMEYYDRNENPQEYIGTKVTTKNIYDTVVGISNIQIKLYKIEEQREYPITWSEVARNSGGEGFLSAFVILSSLLYYMRRDETDIFADRNEGKVIVMDNPFAQTNAAHLLKPLMDMAKKTNTQLVCLSGLGGDSIYSCFDNIYVLNLINASLRDGGQYLKGEHTRGKDEEVMVASQIEVIGQQSLLF